MNSFTKTANLEFLQKFTKGDKEKIRRYIGMYLSTTPQAIQEMLQFYKDGDYESLRLKAHSIKPQVQYMGISDLSAILLQIENIINQNDDKTPLPTLLTSAENLNNKAMDELKKYLEEL